MTLHSIKNVLNTHDTPFIIEADRILAFNGDNFKDVTDMNRDSLLDFLDYDDPEDMYN